jgi:MerR family regulatory protein
VLAMRTVGEVSELAGVTVRTLHHCDEIGLLSPGAGRDRGERRGKRLYAVIGTWPGWACTRTSQSRIAGYGSSSKPPSGATCVYA